MDSPSLIVLVVSVDVKRHLKMKILGGSKLKSCVKLKVNVLASPSLTVLMASEGVKQHLKKKMMGRRSCVKGRGGRRVDHVP